MEITRQWDFEDNNQMMHVKPKLMKFFFYNEKSSQGYLCKLRCCWYSSPQLLEERNLLRTPEYRRKFHYLLFYTFHWIFIWNWMLKIWSFECYIVVVQISWGFDLTLDCLLCCAFYTDWPSSSCSINCKRLCFRQYGIIQVLSVIQLPGLSCVMTIDFLLLLCSSSIESNVVGLFQILASEWILYESQMHMPGFWIFIRRSYWFLKVPVFV